MLTYDDRLASGECGRWKRLPFKSRHLNAYRHLGWPIYERAELITYLLTIHKCVTLTPVTLETRVLTAHKVRTHNVTAKLSNEADLKYQLLWTSL